MGRILYLVVCLLAIGGCSTGNVKKIDVANGVSCSKENPSTLLNPVSQFNATTPTERLECLMGFLRQTQDNEILSSPLPSLTALLLAERTTDAHRRESLATEGVRFAEKALEIGPKNDARLHYYLAENLGLSVREHVTEAAASLPRLEKEMQLAVQLDKSYDQGGPLRLLGTLYLKAPPWPAGIGDGDKALSLLKEAATTYPNHPLNHLFYAQALFEVEEQSSEAIAKSELSKGLQLIEQGPWGYNKPIWREEFSELAKDLGQPLKEPSH
jgi:hypothetical protein